MPTTKLAPMPAEIGQVIRNDYSTYHGALPNNWYVQTPDSLWATMYARMKSQVIARDAAMSEWEREYRDTHVVGYPDEAYWRAYYTEKAKHRVDYPMPWGHIMFERAA